jgi:hypothetical protein
MPKAGVSIGHKTYSSAGPSSPPLSRVEVVDGRVHRLRRPGRIEVLAQERDLALNCTQEHDVLLTVGPPGCLDPALALYLRDGRLRVGEGLDPHIEKAEVLDGSHEPSRELHDFRASRHARRVPEAGANGSSHTTSSESIVCQRALSATSVSMCRRNRSSATVMLPPLDASWRITPHAPPLRRVRRCRLPARSSGARRRVLDPGHVERRAPATLVVPRELEIVALTRHAALDGANTEPGAQSRQRMDVRSKTCGFQRAARAAVRTSQSRSAFRLMTAPHVHAIQTRSS